MDSNFIIVASFLYPHEMEIAKHALESYGIECYSEDNLTVQSYQFISNAIGGVKLLVAEKDLEKAINLLIQKEIISVNSVNKATSIEILVADKLNLIIAQLRTKNTFWILTSTLLIVILLYYFT
jgi:hypothetical protein